MLALESDESIRYLPEILKQLEEEKWTGILDVIKGSEQVGTVFLYQGSIAWAAGRDQSENLGYFLEKIGLIPKQQQKEIFDKLKTLGKSKDLGAVIEETGLISREKLRECLQGHIRSAFSSFQAGGGITYKPRECNVTVTSDLLFSTNEIISLNLEESDTPRDEAVPKPYETVTQPENSEEKSILGNLASLTGYQYSFICDTEGKVLASHMAESLPWNMDEVLPSSTTWIVNSAASLHDLGIGRMEFVLVEHDKGSLIARCPNEENLFFIAASFNENGKPGVIKHKISEMTTYVAQGMM